MYKIILKNNIKVDFNYKIRIYDSSKQLINSLKKEFINPVILFENEDQLLLIDGFRRIKLSNSEQLPAIIFKNKKECYLKALELNMLSSPLHEIEKANSLKIAKEYFDFSDEEIVKTINPILGLAKKVEILDNFISIFNLEENLKEFLIEKKAPVSVFLALLKESKENQTVLHNLFQEKRMSISSIRNIYDLLFYIRKREGVDFKEIIENAINSGDLEKNLEKRRFPTYSKLREKLDILKKDYKNILNFPDDLEETSFLINAKLKSKKEIRDLIKVLEKLENDERFEEFLNYYE